MNKAHYVNRIKETLTVVTFSVFCLLVNGLSLSSSFVILNLCGTSPTIGSKEDIDTNVTNYKKYNIRRDVLQSNDYNIIKIILVVLEQFLK